MSHTTLEPLFDREAALGRLGGDLELLKELAELYKQEYPRAVARLQAAVASQDPVAVRSVAHELKGVVSNFEAKPAFAAALALENMGRSARLEGAPTLVVALGELLNSLRDELSAL